MTPRVTSWSQCLCSSLSFWSCIYRFPPQPRNGRSSEAPHGEHPSMPCVQPLLPQSSVTNPAAYQDFLILVTLLCTFFILLQHLFPVMWYLCGSLTIGLPCSDLWCSNHLWNLLHGLFTFGFPSVLPSVILLHSHLCLLIVHPNMSDILMAKEKKYTDIPSSSFLRCPRLWSLNRLQSTLEKRVINRTSKTVETQWTRWTRLAWT